MIFHPKTDKLLQSYIQNPSLPILFQTESLIDAQAFSAHMADVFLKKDNSKDIISIGLDDDNEAYSIDRLREFKNLLKLLPTGSTNIARIAVIFNMDRFSEESQNTLLKFLEEPPKKTLILLHVNDKQKILETILSRSVHIPLLPITLEQATMAASKLNLSDSSYIKRIYALSAGQSEKFTSMLIDENNSTDIQMAKKFLSSSTFEKLNSYEQYDSRDKIIDLCNLLELIAAAGMHSSQNTSIQRWKTAAIASRVAKNSIRSNVLPKLAYLQLCVNI